MKLLGQWVAVAGLCCAAQAAASVLDAARDLHRQGDFDAALAAYAKVAASDAPPGDRAAALNNACVILTDRGDLVDAARRCEEALALRRTGDDTHRLARTLNNVARVQEALGNLDGARSLHNEALLLNTEHGDQRSQIISLLNLGVLETNAGQFAAALKAYGDAHNLLEQAGTAAWTGYQRTLLKLNTGVALEQIGAFAEALTQLDQALQMAPQHAPGLLADLQLNRGVVLRNLGETVTALAAYDDALAKFDERGDRVAVANVYLNQALVYWIDRGDAARAIPLMDRARAISAATGDANGARAATYFAVRARLDLQQTDQAAEMLAALEPIPSDWLSADARARVAKARGDTLTALQASLAAIDIIESQRAALTARTYRQRLLNDRRGAYALAVDILFDTFQANGDPDTARQALRIAGRAKALALLEATGTAHRWQTQTQVQADHSLLEVLSTQDHFYVWTTGAQSVNWRRLPAPPMVAAANAMHIALRNGLPVSDSASATLRTLLENVEPSLTELVIAPDGALTEIPFELLLAIRAKAPVSRTTVRYSATASKPVTAAERTLAPPQFFALARSSVEPAQTTHPALSALARLSHVQEEVTRAAQHFAPRTRILRDAQASEAALRELKLQPHDVLHIASHAVLDRRLDDGAVLVLATSDDYDGLFFPRDVAALDLEVAMTVLSACSTATGAGTAGSPMTNLTGAFMAAGSRAVLATLWPVDDAGSAVFMDQFYAQLARGLAPHRALHETKRRLASSADWSEPTLWAAFVLYGYSDPIFAPPPKRATGAWLGAGLLAALALLFVWRFR